MGPKRLELSLFEIVEAMTASADDPYFCVLDIEDGTVHAVPRELSDDDSADDELEPDPDRHVEIPRSDARQAYDSMCQFAATVADDEVAGLLGVALQGKGAFARFRDVVRREPELEQRWYAFRDAADREQALAWLASIGIEAIDTSTPRPEPTVPSPSPREPTVSLLDLVLLGAPDGKTELLGGRVQRLVRAPSKGAARHWFRDLARQLCEWLGHPWRRRLIDGKSELELDRFHLRLIDDVVELEVEVAPATWQMFR